MMRRILIRGVAAAGAGRAPACSALARATPATTAATKLANGNTKQAVRGLKTTAAGLRPAAGVAAATGYPTTHDKIQNVENTPYFLDNKFVQSSATKWIDLPDPATNNLVTRVPQMTNEEMKAAVASAEAAFKSWRNTTVLARQQIMFRFVQLIKDNMDRLAASITLEQGKTFADAKGDVLRGLQVAEAAIAAPELLKGEVLEVAKDMETRTYREPLGVTAAICPFSE
jgi:malonate-semialdehyde dehydrogenase (acetylating) / methylmalonate-semialdehyde dehydrogenase